MVAANDRHSVLLQKFAACRDGSGTIRDVADAQDALDATRGKEAESSRERCLLTMDVAEDAEPHDLRSDRHVGYSDGQRAPMPWSSSAPAWPMVRALRPPAG